MKYEPTKDHAERKRILALIERCGKEQTMTKIYRVQMNSKGMPNFSTAVEVADRPQGWIPCSERLPETDNTNEINEFDVLLAVRPKKHPERTPQVYIGKLRPVEGDDGSGNFWGVKTASCEWTIWGWSYFREPEVLAWMPLPEPWEGADDE
jgi:hypothetical protein